jgi:AcrR family transcriptional regulator
MSKVRQERTANGKRLTAGGWKCDPGLGSLRTIVRMPSTFDERLDRLLTASARVFAEKGYHATSMRNLSRASGMSLAGMYHYVSGKEELLYLIQRGSFERVLAGAEAAMAGEADPATRLRAFIRHHVAFFADHMSEMKVLSHEADSLRGERGADIRQLKRRYADLLSDAIAAASPCDPRLAAFGLFGMMNWIYTWYRPDGQVAPDRLADAFADLFLHGIQPGDGTGPGRATRQATELKKRGDA